MRPAPFPAAVVALIERGLLTVEQVEACLDSGGRAERLLETLIERGLVRPTDLPGEIGSSTEPPSLPPLAETLIRGQTGRSAPSDAPGAKTERDLSQVDPGPSTLRTPGARRLGPFDLLEELGRGGMGVVWKARDTRLDRIVAIKGLLGGGAGWSDPEGVRLMREARAAARLRHPGIVPVHEVAEIDGQAFLVMEFIPGTTLTEHLRRIHGGAPRDFREIAGLVRQVADAVAFAHAASVIHRDLKPDNVLIDDAGRAWVGDFGLAKDLRVDAPRLTASGAVMGTPAYMSPEQAEGRAVTTRTDVYGLGAILFEALVGVPPFESTTMVGTLHAVVHDEPRRPSQMDRRVPKALEVICLKCLEKDPERRYATAQEVADELGRVAAGEDIEARPASALARGWRWAGRRRRTIAVVATVAVALGIAAVAGLQALQEADARRRSLLESEFTRRTQVGVVRAIERRRVGDPGPLRTLMAEGVREAEAEIAARAWSPSAWFVKGWLLRLNRRFADAEPALTAALERKPGDAAARFERGMARAGKYREALEAARQRWALQGWAGGTSPAEPSPTELEMQLPELVELRRRAEDDFAALLDPAAESTVGELPAGAVECGRGLLALYRGDLAAARAAIELGLQADGWSDDLWEAQLEIVQRRWNAGDESLSGVLATFDDAIRHNAGRSEWFAHRAERRSFRAAELRRSGKESEAAELWLRAHEDAAAARRLDRDGISPWSVESRLWSEEAECRSARGEDVRPLLQRAVDAATRDLAAFPEFGAALGLRGRALEVMGRLEEERGVDPGPVLERAIADLDRVVAAHPREGSAYCNRGLARWTLASAARRRGDDPRALLGQALADMEQAVQHSPALMAASYRLNRGSLHRDLAREHAARGADASGEIALALTDLDEGVRLCPADPRAWGNRGSVRATAADLIAGRGEDPQPMYDLALADLGHSLELRPDDAVVRYDRALTGMKRAKAAGDRGQDPRAGLRAALADADLAVGLRPAHADSRVTRALIHRELAAAEGARGADPIPLLTQAITDLDEALRLRPTDVGARHNRGSTRAALAAAALAAGQDAGEGYRGALTDLEQVLAERPALTDARVEKGNVGMAYARVLRIQGADPRPVLRQSIADFDAALRAAPSQAVALVGRASACLSFAQTEAQDALLALGWLARALQFYDRALEARPGLWQAVLGRAMVFESFELFDAARAAYELVERQVGDNYPQVRTDLVELRQRAAAVQGQPGLRERCLEDARAARNRGDWASAAAAQQCVLYVLDAESRIWPPAERAAHPPDAAAGAAMLAAHLERARCLSRQSAAGAPADAPGLREQAFDHLQAVRAAGLADPAAWDADADFAPLHVDPRWSALLK